VDALLEPGLVVDVVLDGGWRHPATVVATTKEAIDLGPIGGPLTLPGQLRWITATLEWRAAGSIARSSGVLTAAGSHLLRLTPSGEPLRLQRRRFVRVPAELSAAVVSDSEHKMLARTLDVSVGGMLLSHAEALRVGDAVRFALDLGGSTVSGAGRVVRATPDGDRGIEFDGLQASGERVLGRFVAERQRQRIVLA
jgi:hypothetical protein